LPPGGGYTTTVAQGLALTLLTTPVVLTLGYASISTFVATRLVYTPPEPVTTTPTTLGLDFRAVTVRSRGDGVPLRGWFIPGLLPYPRLGRPRAIGGWGVSMGAATLLLAAAQESVLRAIVADSAYADIRPILDRELPKHSRLPRAFIPGILLAARALYGINFQGIRPVDVVARIAPRPLFFIHGAADALIPPSNTRALAAAARGPRS